MSDLTIVGVAGRIGSGKDVIAARLAEHWGFTILRFSDALKLEVYRKLRGTLRAHLADVRHHLPALAITGGLSDDEVVWRMLTEWRTPVTRALLQEYGTGVRRADDPDYWVRQWKAALWDAAPVVPRIVTPDMRFPNEAQAIQRMGGRLVRVIRPGVPIGLHESENALNGWTPWDAEFVNDGTVDELHAKVDAWWQGAQ